MRLDQPAPLALFLARDVTALLVAEVDARPRGQPLDRLDEGQAVDLLHEPDRVAAFGTGEAVPGEDVVFERKGVTLVNCRAEDFFHSVGLCHLANHPAFPLIRFGSSVEPEAVLV